MQQFGLNLCVEFDGFVDVALRLFDGLADVRVQRADLAGDGICFHGGFYGAATRVAQDEKNLDAKHRDAVFEAGDDLRRNNVACDTRNENLADSLVEYQFDGNAGIGAGENGSERLLFGDGAFPEDREISRK
jgi:hypothetical protein